MLVTSIFSFSHIVSRAYLSRLYKLELFGKGLEVVAKDKLNAVRVVNLTLIE